MPRSIEISVSPEKSDAIIQRLQEIDGIVGVTYHSGASLNPPGDIISIQATNDATRLLLKVLADLEVTDGGSILTSAPKSLISPQYQRKINRESNETIWDEMAFLLRQDTNFASNYLLLMALAGAIAAVGLWADTLHLVIGSMLIAPAFEPLVRLPFGLIAGPWEIASRGFISIVVGYLMLVLGGALTVLILQVVDPGAPLELETRSWIQYWSTFTATGVLVSGFAAAAGAIVIIGQRSVLTTGVMIALALIPSMTIVGMALAMGDFSLAGRGFLRWIVDAGLVVFVSGLVLGLKQIFLHRRKALS